jgi:hypothetical protein
MVAHFPTDSAACRSVLHGEQRRHPDPWLRRLVGFDAQSHFVTSPRFRALAMLPPAKTPKI